MKTKTIVISLMLLGYFGYGQEKTENFVIEKGSWTLGGELGYGEHKTTNSYEDRREKTLKIAPEFGYAIMKNVLVGLEFVYNYTGPDEPNTNDPQITTYGVTHYLRKYFPINQKLAVQLQGELGFYKGTIEGRQTVNQSSETFSMGMRTGCCIN